MGALLEYLETMGLPERPAQVVRWLRTAPVTSGEWLALVKRQAKELTLREVSASLDVSPSRIHHMCKAGVLKKTRSGFVSTRSVYDYIAREEARLSVQLQQHTVLEVERENRVFRKRRGAAGQGVPSPPGSTLVARGSLSGNRIAVGKRSRDVLSQRLQQPVIKSSSDPT